MLCSLLSFAVLANSRLGRLAMRRKLEDTHYRHCWRRSHAHWRWRHRHAPGMQTEPHLEPVTSAGVILPETGQFLLICSLQLSTITTLSSNSCKSASFLCILLPFFGNSLPFLREANGYNRALAIKKCCIRRSG